MYLETKIKSLIIILIFISLFSFIDESTKALAPVLKLPVAGRITFIQPLCKLPIPGINITTIQPAGNKVGSGNWMYIPGVTRNYLWKPPQNINQNVLGLSSKRYLPCMTPGGLFHPPLIIGPGGFQIKYIGTSKF